MIEAIIFNTHAYSQSGATAGGGKNVFDGEMHFTK